MGEEGTRLVAVGFAFRGSLGGDREGGAVGEGVNKGVSHEPGMSALSAPAMVLG